MYVWHLALSGVLPGQLGCGAQQFSLVWCSRTLPRPSTYEYQYRSPCWFFHLPLSSYRCPANISGEHEDIRGASVDIPFF
jgi:hypothetical protein